MGYGTPFNKQHRTFDSGTQGAINELVVAQDMLRKGFQVFRAVAPCASCDLIAIRGDTILRVEVGWSSKFSPTSDRSSKLKNSRYRFDVWAGVTPEGQVRYVPDVLRLDEKVA